MGILPYRQIKSTAIRPVKIVYKIIIPRNRFVRNDWNLFIYLFLQLLYYASLYGTNKTRNTKMRETERNWTTVIKKNPTSFKI